MGSELLKTGSRIKFSLASAWCPGCGNMSAWWPLTYFEVLDDETFCNETQGFYSEGYIRNIKIWKKQSRKIDYATMSIDYLRDLDGEHPIYSHLFDNIIIQERLEKLLGKEYSYFIGSFDLASPIEIKNDIFVTKAISYQSRFIFVIDFAKDVIYVGTKSVVDKIEKINIYSEDDSSSPEVLIKWSKELDLNQKYQNYGN